MTFSRFNFVFFSLFLILSSSTYGQNLAIEEIEIKGNKLTKPFVILRELPFSKGDKIKADLLDEKLQTGKNQLVNLNLFALVSMDANVLNDSVIVVTITLVEKWFIWPIPTLEIADRNFGQWLDFNLNASRLNYGMYLFWYNVGGRNHTIKLALINGYTRNFGLEYRIPYWDKKKKWGQTLVLSNRRNHELVYATSADKQQFYKDPNQDVNIRWLAATQVNYRPGLYKTFFANTGIFNQKVSDTIASLNNAFDAKKGNIQLIYFSVGLVHRKVDNIFYPIKGFEWATSLSFNHLINHQTNWLEWGGGIARYIPLNHGLNAGLAANGRLRSAQKLPYPLQNALGFKNYVRGYEPYVLEGNNYILLKGQLRYALYDRRVLTTKFIPINAYKRTVISSFFSVFADAGWVNKGYQIASLQLNKNQLPGKAMFSAGIGWDWVFYYDKVIRFEYSVNRLNQFALNIHFSKPI